MLIGIDIDDVLLHFTPALIEYHNHTYKTSLTYDQFKSPNFWEVWGGTKEALFELSKKHDLVNITARPNYLETETREAINKYFPNSIQKIYLRDCYGFRKYSKRDVCDSIEVDLPKEIERVNTWDEVLKIIK